MALLVTFSESLVVNFLFGKSLENLIPWSSGLHLSKSCYGWRWAMYINPNLDYVYARTQ